MENWMIRLLPSIFRAITPSIGKALYSALETMKDEARKTPNPVGDLAIAILQEIISSHERK